MIFCSSNNSGNFFYQNFQVLFSGLTIKIDEKFKELFDNLRAPYGRRFIRSDISEQ